jgi:Na+-transporting NADH:ubiquinone oxidoreductase subunit B
MKIGPINFMKQALMRKVIYALIPIVLAALYNFGWRVIPIILIAALSGLVTEWLFKRSSGKPVSEAVFVTAILYALTLPPRTPFWIVAVGMIFGIVFGKEVFGGFGRNVFNPALVGRAFVYVSFPRFLTIEWTAPASSNLMGGITQYIGPSVDAVSTATPMLTYRSTGDMHALFDLFIGRVPGSLGETSALLIILSGAYLLYTKTAHKESMLGVIAGFFAMSGVFVVFGTAQVPNPIFGILSGGILFAAVFMATDPISSPKKKEARWVYGILIGAITVIIRGFALFAGGVMFAVLIGNSLAPLLDEIVKALQARKKSAALKGGTSNA